MRIEKFERIKTEYRIMTEQQKETAKPSARKSCLRFLMGITIVSLCVGGCLHLVYTGITHTDSGEHLSVPTYYPNDATDYSFYDSYTLKMCEFSVPEESFLKYSKSKGWDVVSIEKADAFYPKMERTEPLSRLPEQATITKPLDINRCIRYFKPEHQECYSECKVDPTMLTDKSCLHIVSKGYWYMTINGAGRGITVLYDKENGRCYLERRCR
jgi:hypothetical protein